MDMCIQKWSVFFIKKNDITIIDRDKDIFPVTKWWMGTKILEEKNEWYRFGNQPRKRIKLSNSVLNG